MSGLYFNTITENASRLGMRLQETFSEHTRDLSLARGSNSLYLEAPDEKDKSLGKQLDSSSDREKLDAMKRLVALISKGRNVSEYFAQVVKNVASQNFEIRKLVYIYLLRYAEQEPDLALLSINTFQKDLTDPSPLIRAMALRVLSGIKVPMIGSIIVLAIKKCAADISPYVRRGAALAVPKCHELNASHLPALIDVISILLRDPSPLSIGSVAVAFDVICPSHMDLLHQQYRRLCKILVDVDEWGQINLLNLLARYARTMLSRPSHTLVGEQCIEDVDSDLRLLLTCSEPLLQSQNPAVVIAVTRIFFYVGPPSQTFKVVHPLLRLLNISKEVERVALADILILIQTVPHLFSPFYARFVVRADDIGQVKQDKVKVMLKIINHDNHQAILREFIYCSEDVDDRVIADSIRAVGRCACLIPDCAQQCLTSLMGMTQSKHDVVIGNAIFVLKRLIQTQLELPTTSASPTQSPLTIISHLARRIDDIHPSQAKACVLWLVGQYSASPLPESKAGLNGVIDWAPDVLRKSVKSFSQEPAIVKLQIVTLAAKLLVLCPTHQGVGLLSHYVFSLARYDSNYDVRDRTRMLTSLFGSINGENKGENRGGVILRLEQVKLVLLDGKGRIIENEGTIATDNKDTVLGSLQAITGHFAHRNSLPDWLEKGTDSSLRDNEATKSTAAVTSIQRLGSPLILTPSVSPMDSTIPNIGSKGPLTDLDQFYADDDCESEEQASSRSDEGSDQVSECEGGDEDITSDDDENEQSP